MPSSRHTCTSVTSSSAARFRACFLNSGLYRLYCFFLVIRHLPDALSRRIQVSTKLKPDQKADIETKTEQWHSVGRNMLAGQNIMNTRFLLLSFALVFLTGCSHNLRNVNGESVSLPTYTTVIVLDFKDSTEHATRRYSDREKRRLPELQIEFADLVADQIESDGLYDTVIRGPFKGSGLRVQGKLQAFSEGLGPIQDPGLWSVITLSDNESGDLIGEIYCKHCCNKPLFSCSIEDIMRATAKKVAKEIREAQLSSNDTTKGFPAKGSPPQIL